MKRGFTLIELLSVIVILAIILVIAVPQVIKILENTREDTLKSSVKIVAAEIERKYGINQISNEATIDLSGECPENLTSWDVINGTCSYEIEIVNNNPIATVTINGHGKYDGLSASGTRENVLVIKTDIVNEPLFVESKGVNRPHVVQGMTPIKYDGNQWIETTEDDEDWYSYGTTVDSKKYANVKTEDGSMWVWIPRYSYRIGSGYKSSTSGTFNIKFLKNDTMEASDNTLVETTPIYSGSSQTNFIKHPAFTHKGKELQGFWMAKFKASPSTDSDCYTTPNVSNCNKIDAFPRFVPSVRAYTNIGIKEAYLTSKDMSRTNNPYGVSGNFVDIGLVNNYNWGAVTYLSKSTYGINTSDVWINPTVNGITGCAGSSSSTTQTATCLYSYSTTYGVRGSTTYNITGVYDMRGPRWETVLGNYNNNLGSSNFASADELNDFNHLIYSGSNFGYNNLKFGDALFETSSAAVFNGTSWVGTAAGAWGTSYSYFASTGLPFFRRGGNFADGSYSGIFSFANYTGAPEYLAGGNTISNSFRSVIVIK